MEKTKVEDSGRKKEPAATEVAPETSESTEAKEAHEFHISLHGENIDQKLEDTATISSWFGPYSQGDSGKPDEPFHWLGVGPP